MKFIKVLIAVIATFWLAGCATSYQPRGISGGYSDTRLGDNIFKISFEGNGYTGSGEADDMALMRASEVTIKNGFEYFYILSSSSRSNNFSFVMPSVATTTFNGSGYGNNFNGSAQTMYSGGQVISGSSPSVTLNIVCYKNKDSASMPVIEARTVWDQLSGKYKVTGVTTK
jgi:hypothetical protein